ncbi:hypothetical protein SAMN05421788_11129 [Filimonas lacunae]|uniref:Uncharacterized protein n=1 Tax=Filimonas lacunae TaxID=477680 RepID=A0A1N7RAH4_9BACT|nr:hypothetical protein [Filimonas lacunae]SIT32111.1 hypothetical protein SAMN05421788_11129 [Filimonas lacunae]
MKTTVLLTLLVILSVSCHITQKSVAGNWVSTFHEDTIHFKKDSTFHYNVYARSYHDSLPPVIDSIIRYHGTYIVSKNHVYFTFDNDKKAWTFQQSLQKWSILGRHKLMHPMHNFPSNKFQVFVKIK